MHGLLLTQPTTVHAFSTVEANWGLSSLGHGDTDKYVTRRSGRSLTLARLTISLHGTLSNVFSFVAAATGYTNLNVSGSDVITDTTV